MDESLQVLGRPVARKALLNSRHDHPSLILPRRVYRPDDQQRRPVLNCHHAGCPSRHHSGQLHRLRYHHVDRLSTVSTDADLQNQQHLHCRLDHLSLRFLLEPLQAPGRAHRTARTMSSARPRTILLHCLLCPPSDSLWTRDSPELLSHLRNHHPWYQNSQKGVAQRLRLHHFQLVGRTHQRR